MDGENNGKPMKTHEKLNDLGGFTTPIFGSTPISGSDKMTAIGTSRPKFLLQTTKRQEVFDSVPFDLYDIQSLQSHETIPCSRLIVMGSPNNGKRDPYHEPISLGILM